MCLLLVLHLDWQVNVGLELLPIRLFLPEVMKSCCILGTYSTVGIYLGTYLRYLPNLPW